MPIRSRLAGGGRGFVRRANRRPRRARQYGMRKMKPLKGFSRLQSATIRRAIGLSEETKYQATTLQLNRFLDPAIHTPGTDMLPLVPKIAVGTGENQRIGRKVTPVRCRVAVNLSFAQTNPGAPTPPAEQQRSQNIYAVMYVLRSKSYKNFYQWEQSPNWANILDNGDGTSVPCGYQAGATPFWTLDASYLSKPIESSEYTLIAKRIVKLTKNVGMIDAGVAGNSQVPNLVNTSYRGSFSYKLPTLQYDDTNSVQFQGYPTNANVILAVGWCYADNQGTYDVDAEGNPVAPYSALSLTAVNHVWYKDG